MQVICSLLDEGRKKVLLHPTVMILESFNFGFKLVDPSIPLSLEVLTRIVQSSHLRVMMSPLLKHRNNSDDGESKANHLTPLLLLAPECKSVDKEAV
jgi:hypothetical protein